jgi:hypothetical protein
MEKMVNFFFQKNHKKKTFSAEISSINGLPQNLGDRQRVSQSERFIFLFLPVLPV